MKRYWIAAILLAMAALVATWYAARAPASYAWALPEGLPLPAVPDDNPMSDRKVALGRWLFYDKRLSVNGTTSCASCHVQQLAFTDGRPVSVGATGELHPRGSMSLVNVAYATRLTWANHLLARLEDQALVPLFGELPVEMGMAGKDQDFVALLQNDVQYRELFPVAFPSDVDPYSILNAVRAIASFVRSIISFDSPYDHYLAGDRLALSASATRGMDLFFSERLECFHCHGGFYFTDSSTHASAVVESAGFHNNGLYNIDNTGAYPDDNTGLHDLTGIRHDMGRFRAPTLRNIALTAPYMHDGSMATLDEVFDHYQRGGRNVESGPYAGDGRRNPYKSVMVRAFELSDAERQDVLDFLHSLTDDSVRTNPAFSDPFASQ
jgi:cytochrome c peroxidase